MHPDLNVLKTEIAASYFMFLAYNISGGKGARKIDTKIEREPRYCYGSIWLSKILSILQSKINNVLKLTASLTLTNVYKLNDSV